jgi:FtsP/CotA-like multicopper oxidase with cupredoxin domain
MKKWSTWAALFLSVGLSAQSLKTFQLTASEDESAEMSDGTVLPIWGFQITGEGPAKYPAPRLVVEEGDSVQVSVYNAGNMAHTFHLHGFGSDTSNNGEALNPVLVQPGNTEIFAFRATQAGDYFYHCGLQNPVHGQMGMAGLLTVLAAGGEKKAYTNGPTYFKDYHWLLGEFDAAWHFDPPQAGNLPPFEPDYFLVNGKAGDALGDYNAEDVAVFSALDQLPVFLNITHSGTGLREVVFPYLLIEASVVIRNGEPQIPAWLVDTLALSPGESVGLMLQAVSNGEDSIRVNYYAPGTDAFLYQNPVAIFILHHSATSEPAARGMVQILPNPAMDWLTLRFKSAPPQGKAIVEIFSENGTSMLRQGLLTGQPIHVNELSSGVYVLKVMDENGLLIATQSFVKK